MESIRRASIPAAVLFIFETLFAAAPAAAAGTVKLGGNFIMQEDLRRDADAEYINRRPGFEDPRSQINGRGLVWNQDPSRSVELNLWAYPASPIEVYLQMYNGYDNWLDEAHTRIQLGDQDRNKGTGLESYFCYRQGRLSLGDPLLNIVDGTAREGNDGAFGIATEGWLRPGAFNVDSGQWKYEVNMFNTSNTIWFLDPSLMTSTGTGSSPADDNEVLATKLRHELRIRSDFTISSEGLYTRKAYNDVFSGFSAGFPGIFSPIHLVDQLAGFDAVVSYKATTLSFEWLTSDFPGLNDSAAAEWGMSRYRTAMPFGTPNDDALAVDIRNVTILKGDRIGRIGFNANYRRTGRNYVNTVGGAGTDDRLQTTEHGLFNPAGKEYVHYADVIQSNGHTYIGGFVGRSRFLEVFWDLPKIDGNITGRFRRREEEMGGDLLTQQAEVEARIGLVKGMDLRTLFRSELLGAIPFLVDIDAGRSIVGTSRRSRDAWTSLTYRQKWGHLRADARWYQPYGLYTAWVAGAEASYKFTPRITGLVRQLRYWVDQPHNAWGITRRPDDVGGGSTSVVEPFHRRYGTFAGLTVTPTDNSKILIEYGASWHSNDDLALDSAFLFPGRRTEDKVFAKLEMWF